MASVVDICNIALSHVGGGRIVSLNDSTEEAAQCSLHYQFARDKVLGEREWTFAVTRRELAQVSRSPNFGYPAQFQVPSDAIRVLNCYDGPDYTALDINGLDWHKEGETIVADSEQLWCRYLARVEDPNKFTAGFIEAVATYLAHKICVPLTQNRGMSNDLLSLYEMELAKAATTDGMQGRSSTIRKSRLITARRR